MLWIREEEVFPGSDYGAFVQRCRDLDLDGVRGDVRREDPEASPALFCRHLCLVVSMARAWCPLGCAQALLATWNG